jgi:hypothetical protein
MKIQGYQTIGRSEIVRYTQSWKAVFQGLLCQIAEISMGARKQRVGWAAAPQGGGKITHTRRRFYVERPLAYFSAGAVQ